jgi:CdiI immunity protein
MNNPRKDAKEFSALRSFLRGYLHEDWKQEYESVEQAAHDFWEDANAEERSEVRSEWLDFVESLKGQPLDKISRRLLDLGSAWRPQNQSELDAITRALQRYPSD